MSTEGAEAYELPQEGLQMSTGASWKMKSVDQIYLNVATLIY